VNHSRKNGGGEPYDEEEKERGLDWKGLGRKSKTMPIHKDSVGTVFYWGAPEISVESPPPVRKD